MMSPLMLSMQDISCSHQPTMTEPLNNFDSSGVWLLDQTASQGEFFNTNYLSPSSSVSSDHSQYSDYSLASPSYTININLSDIESQVSRQQFSPLLLVEEYRWFALIF